MKQNIDTELTGVLFCPICAKEKVFVYGAKGQVTSRCGLCKRMILWDYTNMHAAETSNKAINKTMLTEQHRGTAVRAE